MARFQRRSVWLVIAALVAGGLAGSWPGGPGVAGEARQYLMVKLADGVSLSADRRAVGDRPDRMAAAEALSAALDDPAVDGVVPLASGGYAAVILAEGADAAAVDRLAARLASLSAVALVYPGPVGGPASATQLPQPPGGSAPAPR